DSVQFEYDGEKIDVRREKLDGIIFYQPTRREFSAPLCRLVDAGGSTWALRDVQLAGGSLNAATVGSVNLELPLAAVSKVDFSIGNIAFLSELEPDSGLGDPAVSLQPAAMSYKFGSMLRARAAPPLGADTFRIAGVKYASGLSLHSPVTLVYRVPAGFRWLRLLAGVDDSIVAPGRFDLVILGDGKELVRKTFDGKKLSDKQARAAAPIDLEVAGVRRISIVLDPADGQDFGDQLDLVEARFTK
ncbi:MAG TPA: NPCBM/NEW2 domain-containing protein, partial [Pirellulaceae bacterium]|nr:NPCBM/NEW2 domain-containing protein [Pirellulaceae bacterium]